MNWFGPSGDCGCCGGDGGCTNPSIVTITAGSSPCDVLFAGSYGLAGGIGALGLSCPHACNVGANLGYSPTTCTTGSGDWERLGTNIVVFSDGAIIDVQIYITFHFIGGSNTALVGGFRSTDTGATFGSFVANQYPAGCTPSTPPSSTTPTDGSGLACSVTF